jgi:hypothetical protein
LCISIDRQCRGESGYVNVRSAALVAGRAGNAMPANHRCQGDTSERGARLDRNVMPHESRQRILDP